LKAHKSGSGCEVACSDQDFYALCMLIGNPDIRWLTLERGPESFGERPRKFASVSYSVADLERSGLSAEIPATVIE